MDTTKLHDTEVVLATLNRLHDEFEELMRIADGWRSISREDAIPLKDRLAKLKAELKALAKTETVDGVRRAQTGLEANFFGPAVRHASANFLMRVDAPLSQWISGIYNSSTDLSYFIYQLNDYLKERGYPSQSG